MEATREARLNAILGPGAAGALRGHTLVLYDGVCRLCNGTVRFLLENDRRGRMFYAPLESPVGRAMLRADPELPADPAAVQSVLVFTDVLTGRQELHQRSEAALTALATLGPGWALVAAVARLLPRGLRDWGYRRVARVRYRLFGRLPFCPLPSAQQRGRILL